MKTLTHHASRITALAICLFTFAAHAGTVRVAWSPSPDAASEPITYAIYAHTNVLSETNLNSAVLRIDAGVSLSAMLSFTNAARWHLVVTAVDANYVESAPSNMLTLEVPAPPAGLRTVVVEHTIDLSTSTGWQDVGYFRLKLTP